MRCKHCKRWFGRHAKDCSTIRLKPIWAPPVARSRPTVIYTQTNPTSPNDDWVRRRFVGFEPVIVEDPAPVTFGSISDYAPPSEARTVEVFTGFSGGDSGGSGASDSWSSSSDSGSSSDSSSSCDSSSSSDSVCSGGGE